MAIVALSPMEWAQLGIFRRDTDNSFTNYDASAHGDLTPFQNLKSRYYPVQASYNLSWQVTPPTWPLQTFQESKVNHLSDEVVRQFAAGAALVNQALSPYKMAATGR